MKHKKQLRKVQEDRKNPGDVERSVEKSSVSELNQSGDELKHRLEPDSYLLEENDEDEVDIEDIYSPDHLL